MKKPTICAVVFGTAFLFYLVMPYLQGRTNSIWVVPPLFPAAVVPLLGMLLSCGALFIFSISACITKRHIGMTISMFIASGVLFFVSFKVPNADLFQRGFNDYARTVLTFDEWRQIASFAQGHLKTGIRYWGPDLAYGRGTNADDALRPAFNAATQIQKLGTTYSIFAYTNKTEIFWGSALVGHRGVIVFSGPNPQNNVADYSDLKFMTNDVATFVGD